jgi:hypothetical protein
MATLNEILSMWEKDAVIDETNLSHEASRNPMLHSKYLTILATTKLQLQKAESDLLNTRRIKTRYYRGEMTKAELQELEWVQFQGRSLTKAELEDTLRMDPDAIRLTDKAMYFQTVKETCESILKEINGRVWSVRTSVDFQKFQAGVN